MRNTAYFLLPFSLLAASSAFAEELPVEPAPPAADAPSAPSGEPTLETTPPASQPPPQAAAQPAPSAAPPVARATSSAPESTSDPLLRPALAHVSGQMRLRRYSESALGLTGAGVLFGVGFAAEAPDMTWSHALWVTSGIVALGSIANLLVPSELEGLERSSATLTEQELERRWERLAHKALVGRRVEAALGGLFGIASVSLGVLAFEGELGTLTEDQQRIIGSVLIGGGALGIAESAVQWFVPTPIETGFALAQTRPKVSLASSPSPNGFHMSLTGSF